MEKYIFNKVSIFNYNYNSISQFKKINIYFYLINYLSKKIEITID
jgi:hypothetical protein